jgi:glycerol-3-phosphate O-acyltransferase
LTATRTASQTFIWPAPAGDQTLVLGFAKTAAERRLISEWLATCAAKDAELELLDQAPDARLEQALHDAHTDAWVVPVRVAWLPREHNGARAARLRDLVSLNNPRRPGTRMQEQILRHEPDRARIVAAEPARVTELQARFEHSKDSDGFPAFVGRQALLALARAERRYQGLQYKVPKLVVEELEASPRFHAKVAELATKLGRPRHEVEAEAQQHLHEMVASHSRLAIDAWGQFGRWLSRAYEIEIDEQEVEQLRALGETYPLAFLPSHRSYLDPLVMRSALHRHGFAPNHVLGGLNVSFWPIGPVARRSGLVFIRRSTKNEPVYKLVLREYIGYLARKRFNLEWYIEGGRTRTGKLRPPRYGLLNYLVEAAEDTDVMLIPTSIVYDQLYEVEAMAAEEHGAAKTPESLSWLVGYARAQGRGFGKVRVQFGEPMSLQEALAQASDHPVERVAIEVMHRINRATSITETALTAFALLGIEDRALTLTEIRATLDPLLGYVGQRQLPVTGQLDLHTERGVLQALDALARHGVASRYSGGTEPVWSIDRHLEAAFYRNSIIHFFVVRAIAELVLAHVSENGHTAVEAGWQEALRIRDMLKFEFFFARKRDFESELREELALIDPDWERLAAVPDVALRVLKASGPLLAPRVLSSFVEAYLVVAEQLVAQEGPLDEKEFLGRCLGVAHQKRLQKQLASTESISRELFATALKLADNRGLTPPAATPSAGATASARAPETALTERRQAFATEIAELVDRLATIRAL